MNRPMQHPGLDGKARREMPRAGRDGAGVPKFFGLVELSADGTVLYSRAEPDGAPGHGGGGAAGADFTGRNFYTEVAPFKNVGEFRESVEGFSRGTLPAHSMDFTCQYDDGPLPVLMLLARIRERSESEVTKSVLVHIRRPQ